MATGNFIDMRTQLFEIIVEIRKHTVSREARRVLTYNGAAARLLTALLGRLQLV